MQRTQVHMKLTQLISQSKHIGLALVLGGFLLSTQLVQAVQFDPKAGDKTGLLQTGGSSIANIDLGHEAPTVVAFQLINSALSLLAGLCVGLLVYAGFLWIWARGKEDEIQKAKDIILGTVIGLVIVLAALGITYFVFQNVASITGAIVTN